MGTVFPLLGKLLALGKSSVTCLHSAQIRSARFRTMSTSRGMPRTASSSWILDKLLQLFEALLLRPKFWLVFNFV